MVWRLYGHSVLTQAIDGNPGDASSELTGWAALVWVALDEPATLDDLCGRLDAVPADVVSALDSMLASLHVQLG